MFLQIKSHDTVIHELDVDEHAFDYVTDSNGILGLSVVRGNTNEGTIYMSPDFTFHIKGFAKALSPKTVKQICELPKPRSLSEISKIIQEQK